LLKSQAPNPPLLWLRVSLLNKKQEKKKLMKFNFLQLFNKNGLSSDQYDMAGTILVTLSHNFMI
jgi:hypothetical protein